MIPENQRVDRRTALELMTVGSAWFSGEEHVKGRIKTGQYADFTLLDQDYFAVPAKDIDTIASDLTVVGGKAVYASKALADQIPTEKIAPLLPPNGHR